MIGAEHLFRIFLVGRLEEIVTDSDPL